MFCHTGLDGLTDLATLNLATLLGVDAGDVLGQHVDTCYFVPRQPLAKADVECFDVWLEGNQSWLLHLHSGVGFVVGPLRVWHAAANVAACGMHCLAGDMTPCVLAFHFPNPGLFSCSFLNPCGGQLVCSISTVLLVMNFSRHGVTCWIPPMSPQCGLPVQPSIGLQTLA